MCGEGREDGSTGYGGRDADDYVLVFFVFQSAKVRGPATTMPVAKRGAVRSFAPQTTGVHEVSQAVTTVGPSVEGLRLLSPHEPERTARNGRVE